MTNPSGHLWREKWGVLSGPLSSQGGWGGGRRHDVQLYEEEAISSRKSTPRDYLYWQYQSKYVASSIETKFINYECFHMIFGGAGEDPHLVVIYIYIYIYIYVYIYMYLY